MEVTNTDCSGSSFCKGCIRGLEWTVVFPCFFLPSKFYSFWTSLSCFQFLHPFIPFDFLTHSIGYITIRKSNGKFKILPSGPMSQNNSSLQGSHPQKRRPLSHCSPLCLCCCDAKIAADLLHSADCWQFTDSKLSHLWAFISTDWQKAISLSILICICPFSYSSDMIKH